MHSLGKLGVQYSMRPMFIILGSGRGWPNVLCARKVQGLVLAKFIIAIVGDNVVSVVSGGEVGRRLAGHCVPGHLHYLTAPAGDDLRDHVVLGVVHVVAELGAMQGAEFSWETAQGLGAEYALLGTLL